MTSTGFVEQVMSMKLPELTKVRDNSGRTPLHYAASAGNLPAVMLLLEKDRTSACIADSAGSFAVHDAAKLGHLEVLKELFMKCPDSDELLDGQGKNFLHLAVEEKRVNVVQWVCKNVMLEKAMNAQDDEGNTPLHLAVKAKNKTIFAYLTLSKKVHLNWVNRDGLTPLDIACTLVKDDSLHSQVLVWKNENYVILRALERIGCFCGINRTNNRNNEEMDQGMEHEEGGRIERMAQSISIVSVLVASTTFTAALAVAEASINLNELYDDDDDDSLFSKDLALVAFFVLDIWAFVLSMIGTLLLMYASSPYMDYKDRKNNLFFSVFFTMSASKFLWGAFVTGTFVLLTASNVEVTDTLFTVGLWLCIIQFAFATPLMSDGPLVARAIANNIGWRDYIIGRTNQASKKRIPYFIVGIRCLDMAIFFLSLFISLAPLIADTFFSEEYTSPLESNCCYPT